ncbi:MAG: transcriptional regulator, TraR/DksA family protein [Nitrospirales bacterium]|nr:transcriptional regulator, TraR/DksA family protein [Nitrospirales bacterium]
MGSKPSKKPSPASSKSVKPRATSKSAASPAKTQARNVKKAPQKPAKPKESSRKEVLREILLAKRDNLLQIMQAQLGQSLTDEQQRRLESAMDSGDQALNDLEREMGISLQEMRNKERQLIDDALVSLEEGTYGKCAECNTDISEKRLEALPFAGYCIECKSRLELLEKIEKGEQRY